MEESKEVLEQADERELEEAWEEDSAPLQTQNGEPDREEAPDGEQGSAETGEFSPAGGEEGRDDDELFTLKNRDETRQVTRQELIAMAQKGWDYDRVRQERDQLRQYRQAMEQVRAPIQTTPKAEVLMQRVKANAQRQDMERFLQAYPTVKAESIPREVWGQVARGVPLVSAYAMHENQQMKIQLAAQRQNQLNRQRTPGTLGANVGGELDELDRMWNEDD